MAGVTDYQVLSAPSLVALVLLVQVQVTTGDWLPSGQPFPDGANWCLAMVKK